MGSKLQHERANNERLQGNCNGKSESGVDGRATSLLVGEKIWQRAEKQRKPSRDETTVQEIRKMVAGGTQVHMIFDKSSSGGHSKQERVVTTDRAVSQKRGDPDPRGNHGIADAYRKEKVECMQGNWENWGRGRSGGRSIL